MGMWQKAKLVLREPTVFFSHLRTKEKGVRDAFKFYAIFSLVGIILTILVHPLNTAIWKGIFFPMAEALSSTSTGQMAVTQIINYVLGLPFSFVMAGILHVWILIWSGREPYSKTYQLSVYSATPYFLFGWIPILGSLVFIYWLVLIIIGTQHVQRIPKTKSMLMYILPIALLILFLIAVFGWAFMTQLPLM